MASCRPRFLVVQKLHTIAPFLLRKTDGCKVCASSADDSFCKNESERHVHEAVLHLCPWAFKPPPLFPGWVIVALMHTANRIPSQKHRTEEPVLLRWACRSPGLSRQEDIVRAEAENTGGCARIECAT